MLGKKGRASTTPGESATVPFRSGNKRYANTDVGIERGDEEDAAPDAGDRLLNMGPGSPLAGDHPNGECYHPFHQHCVMPAPEVPPRSAFLRRRRDGHLANFPTPAFPAATSGSSPTGELDSAFTPRGGRTPTLHLPPPPVAVAEDLLEVEDEFDDVLEDDLATFPSSRKKQRVVTSRTEPIELNFTTSTPAKGASDLHESLAACAIHDHFDVETSLNEFHKYTAGTSSDCISEDGILRIAKDLGWPDKGRPDFFYLLFALHRSCDIQHRTVLSISRKTWLDAFAEMGASSLASAAHIMGSELKRAYHDRSTLYSNFHRIVFTFLLVCDRPFPHRNFARTLSTSVAQMALIATLSQLSPYAGSFCAFLDASNAPYINLDQWTNFLTFSRTVALPKAEEFTTHHCWPLLIDEYVAWGIANKVFSRTVWAHEKQRFEVPQPLAAPTLPPATASAADFGGRPVGASTPQGICPPPHFPSTLQPPPSGQQPVPVVAGGVASMMSPFQFQATSQFQNTAPLLRAGNTTADSASGSSGGALRSGDRDPFLRIG